MLGLARTARIENGFLDLITIDAEYVQSYSNDLTQKLVEIHIKSFCISTPEASREFEYAYRCGSVLISRLIPDVNINNRLRGSDVRPQINSGLFRQQDRPLKLFKKLSDSLERLNLIDDTSIQVSLGSNEIEIQVEACELNLKDVSLVSGQARTFAGMIGGYTGVVVDVGSNFTDKYDIGDRVCSLGSTSYASFIRVDGHSTSHLPMTIPFTVGASIPLSFATAYYGLVELERLEKVQAVLIHTASSGVGQAALKIAQYIGVKIFATIGSASERQLLTDEFNLAEDHIFSIRSTTFRRGILRLTKGAGVDVVLNSLSGESLKDSWACVAKFGTFIEIWNFDTSFKRQLDMKPFNMNVIFTSFDMTVLFKERPEKTQKLMTQIMFMFSSEKLTSVKSIKVLPITGIEDSLRLVRAENYIGGCVLKARGDTLVKATKSSFAFRLHHNSTYVVAGGLGGLGLQILRFMAMHGVKYIVILSRRELTLEKQKALADEVLSLGVKVRIFRCDISVRADVDKLVESFLSDMPSVAGVVQSAMDLNASTLSFWSHLSSNSCLGPFS